MDSKIRIRELKEINVNKGYLIDGFPSSGISNAIATESMINTSKFDLVGVIDSNNFPPISIIKNGKPSYPTRIFANEELNVSIFQSHLKINESLQREIAETMLEWAKKHKIELIVSSITIKSTNKTKDIFAVGNTKFAREKLKNTRFKSFENGIIPGIPGILLNEGGITDQNVIVIIVYEEDNKLDFKTSAQLCLAMSQLIPGASCDISKLQKEAEHAEHEIKETDENSRHIDSMYG